jgi:hypothetical protein
MDPGRVNVLPELRQAREIDPEPFPVTLARRP